MSDLQTPVSSSGPDTLREECAALRQQNGMLTLAMIVLALIFGGYVFLMDSQLRSDLAVGSKIVDEYNLNAPEAEALVGRLREYGRTHADFAPIVQKYGLNAAPPAAAPAPKK